MSVNLCSNFTGIIRLLQDLPTITNLDADNPLELSSVDFDKFVRAWFWGGVIVITTVALLYATWFYYCCVCCCYCCGSRNDEMKPRAYRACCGCITVLLVILTLGLPCVIIWMELRFDDGITKNYLGIESVINTTAIDNFTSPVLDLRMLERFRHYSGLSWISLVIVIVLSSICTFICAPICKSQAVVNVFIGVYAITSFLSSVYSGVLFAYLISLSDQCQDIQLRLSNSSTNISSVDDLVLQFNSLCNETSQCGFTLLLMGCGLIVFFILVQTVAAQYAGSLTRSKYKYVEYSSEIVISAPISVSGPGVWGAYGTQALIGTTSQGQSVPQTYARNPMIPSTEQYMSHSDNDLSGASHPNYLRVQSQTSQDQGNFSDATNSFDLTNSYDFGTSF